MNSMKAKDYFACVRTCVRVYIFLFLFLSALSALSLLSLCSLYLRSLSVLCAAQGKTEDLVLADLADAHGLTSTGSMLFYTLVSRVRELGGIAFFTVLSY
jgi:hypothetical protein